MPGWRGAYFKGKREGARMKSIIDAELSEIERRIYGVLAERGMDPVEVQREFDDFITQFEAIGGDARSDVLGAYAFVLLAVGTSRFDIEKKIPAYGSAVQMLTSASRGLGALLERERAKSSFSPGNESELDNELIAAIQRRGRSELAKRGADARHAKDPKTTEKSFVLECWRDWQQNPLKYKGKAAFARDMLDKCLHLESQKKIEDWCREWEKSEPC